MLLIYKSLVGFIYRTILILQKSNNYTKVVILTPAVKFITYIANLLKFILEKYED